MRTPKQPPKPPLTTVSPDMWLKVLGDAIPHVMAAIRDPRTPGLGPRAPVDGTVPPYSLTRVVQSAALSALGPAALTAFRSLDEGVDRGLLALAQMVSLRHPHLSLAALLNWETTKGVYRFDPDAAAEIAGTSVDTIDVDAFATLPEWSAYVDMAGCCAAVGQREGEFRGFFVHLMPGASLRLVAPDGGVDLGSTASLLVVLDMDADLIPVPLILERNRTLQQAWDECQARMDSVTVPSGAAQAGALAAPEYISLARALLPLALYLTSSEPDIAGAWPPAAARSSKIRTGKWLAASAPVVRGVGTRIGGALRAHRRRSAVASASGRQLGAGVEPHVRRAHWHSFWTGPRHGTRQLVVRWMPPILVNMDMDPTIMPASLRAVERRRGDPA